MIDFHVHSDCSGDCLVPMLDACRAAVDHGIKIICFTDHIDFEPTDVCFGAFDHQLYESRIAEAREAFAGVLDIRCGVEIDYVDRHQSSIEHFLDGKHFDYVLGATHYVGGIILEDHERYFPGKCADDAYTPYFENVLATAETGWFDTLAHMDLCKRYGVRYFGALDWTPYRERIEQILRVVIARDMALEINTSGLRQSPEDTYPSRELLELYFALGGRLITIGSDAHKTMDVGAGVDAALELAREVGFDSVATFSRRQRVLTPIT